MPRFEIGLTFEVEEPAKVRKWAKANASGLGLPVDDLTDAALLRHVLMDTPTALQRQRVFGIRLVDFHAEPTEA